MDILGLAGSISRIGLAGQDINEFKSRKAACTEEGGTLGMYGFFSPPKCYKKNKNGEDTEIKFKLKAESGGASIKKGHKYHKRRKNKSNKVRKNKSKKVRKNIN